MLLDNLHKYLHTLGGDFTPSRPEPGQISGNTYIKYYEKKDGLSDKDGYALHEEVTIDSNSNLTVELHIGNEYFKDADTSIQNLFKYKNKPLQSSDMGKVNDKEHKYVYYRLSANVQKYNDVNFKDIQKVIDKIIDFHNSIAKPIIDLLHS